MYFKKLLLVGVYVLGVFGFPRWDASGATLGGFSLSCTKKLCGNGTLACFCTSSVEGGAFVKGSQLDGDTLLLKVEAPNGGLLACGNGGNTNPSPGIQVTQTTEPQLFSTSITILKSQLQGNTFTTTDLLASLPDAPLQLLADAHCPSTTWFGLDFVPCTDNPFVPAAIMTLALFNDNQQQVIQQKYSCSRTCDIGFTANPNTKEFSFNSLPYTCTEMP